MLFFGNLHNITYNEVHRQTDRYVHKRNKYCISLINNYYTKKSKNRGDKAKSIRLCRRQLRGLYIKIKLKKNQEIKSNYL